MAEQIGEFLVDGELGRGGMGIVYRARQTGLDRVVALKVLPPELGHDDTFARRFLDEARRTASLDHSHIAKVYTVGEDGTKRFFSMQYLPGGSLEERLRAGPLSLEAAARVAADVADALGYAHARGIVHRDIKPANIMFDDQGEAIVTDFGIAKASDGTRLTSTGMLIGSPPYMSPEQVKGNPVDGRSDIYALGVVLFRMATGRLPYDAESSLALAMMHVQQPVPDPRAANPGVPEWLASIIIKSLQKEPAERFLTAADMAQALRERRTVRVETVTGQVPMYPQVAATQPGAYQQPATYPQPGAYQQPGTYQQPVAYQQTGTPPGQGGSKTLVVVAVLLALLGLMAVGVALGVMAMRKGGDDSSSPPTVALGGTPKAPPVATGPEPPALPPVDASKSAPPAVSPPVGDMSPNYVPLGCRREIHESDLAGKSKLDLDVMRNEIFAYHGRPFVREDLASYFAKRPWYHNKGSAFTEDDMTAMEKHNAEFIKRYQESH